MVKKSTLITSLIFAVSVTIILTLTLADSVRPRVTVIEEESSEIVEELVEDVLEEERIIPLDAYEVPVELYTCVDSLVMANYSQVQSYDPLVAYNVDKSTYIVTIEHTTIKVDVDLNNPDNNSIHDFSSNYVKELDFSNVPYLSKSTYNTVNDILKDMEEDSVVGDIILAGDVISVFFDSGNVYDIDLNKKSLVTH